MGLGSSEPRREVFYLAMKAKRDKDLDPHFAVSKRENSKTIKLNDETEVSGYLIAIGHSKYEWPKNSGEHVDTLSLRLIDGAAEFKVETSVDTSLARNLMNKIVGVGAWGWIKLRLYQKNEYAQLYVSNDDQPMPWRFDYETELKPLVREVEDPKKPGKYVKVYNKITELLFNEWIRCERLVQENARKNPAIVEEILKVSKSTTNGIPAAAPANNEPLKGDDFPTPSDGPTDDEPPFIPPSSNDDDLPF